MGRVGDQHFMLCPKILKSHIPMSMVGGWVVRGVGVETNFQKSTSNFLNPVQS